MEAAIVSSDEEANPLTITNDTDDEEGEEGESSHATALKNLLNNTVGHKLHHPPLDCLIWMVQSSTSMEQEGVMRNKYKLCPITLVTC